MQNYLDKQTFGNVKHFDQKFWDLGNLGISPFGQTQTCNEHDTSVDRYSRWKDNCSSTLSLSDRLNVIVNCECECDETRTWTRTWMAIGNMITGILRTLKRAVATNALFAVNTFLSSIMT